MKCTEAAGELQEKLRLPQFTFVELLPVNPT